jgi:hypothetical protein
MSPATPGRPYMSARGVAQTRERLSGRDLAIIRQVAGLRLMSAKQIQAVHFPDAAHDNEQAATRARQRVLERLTRERLLIRLERRIGGVRAGSAGFVLALGPVGQRVLAASGSRRRACSMCWTFKLSRAAGGSSPGRAGGACCVPIRLWHSGAAGMSCAGSSR